MKKMNVSYVPTDPRLVEPSSFEQACTLLETTSQILQSCSPELNKSQTPRSFGVDDAIALQFRTYVDTLKPLYEELEKFGTMCQLYAKKLPKQDLKADTCRPRANSKNAQALPIPHFQKVTSRPRSISIAITSSAQVETREDDTQAQKFDEIGKLAMKAVSLFRSLFYYLSEEVALFGFEKVNLE